MCGWRPLHCYARVGLGTTGHYGGGGGGGVPAGLLSSTSSQILTQKRKWRSVCGHSLSGHTFANREYLRCSAPIKFYFGRRMLLWRQMSRLSKVVNNFNTACVINTKTMQINTTQIYIFISFTFGRLLICRECGKLYEKLTFRKSPKHWK